MEDQLTKGDESCLKDVVPIGKMDDLFPPTEETVQASKAGTVIKIYERLGKQPHRGKFSDKPEEYAYIIEWATSAGSIIRDIVWGSNLATSEEAKARVQIRKDKIKAFSPGAICKVVEGTLKNCIGRVSPLGANDNYCVGVVIPPRHLEGKSTDGVQKDKSGAYLIYVEQLQLGL